MQKSLLKFTVFSLKATAFSIRVLHSSIAFPDRTSKEISVRLSIHPAPIYPSIFVCYYADRVKSGTSPLASRVLWDSSSPRVSPRHPISMPGQNLRAYITFMDRQRCRVPTCL